MYHNLELREKVIDYVENKGSVTKASRIFGVSRASIYRWLTRENLKPTIVKYRHRKLNWSALYRDVIENPDDKLIERANKFGVTVPAISYAFKRMKITRKKNSYAIEREIVQRE
ncbi:mobile element protein (plasmid) [Geminocystis sp. NIES-3709]|nr:mobile element protein [Geminocystis sp. NIES-3709]BAQ67064.1 mobile element protein [Geminocystis sp. NIES-3709]